MQTTNSVTVQTKTKLFNLVPGSRKFLWRLGRRMYLWARQEVAGGPEINGEYWLLQKIINEFCSENKCTFIDIGANKGNWSHQASKLLKSKGCSDAAIYAFEPAHESYKYLSSRFAQTTHVKVKNFAVTDSESEKDFFVMGTLAGTNTLTPFPGARIERVRTLKLDHFLKLEAIERVTFVKSDTEGHDLSVIRGAADSLAKGCIDIWQFEYNHLWIYQKAFIKDVFDLVADKPYYVGKLYSEGIEIFDQWHPELEKFFDCNYILIHKNFPIKKYCKNVYFNFRNITSTVTKNTRAH